MKGVQVNFARANVLVTGSLAPDRAAAGFRMFGSLWYVFR